MMPARHDEAMVVRTLAFMVVRQVLSLVGLGPSPDANDAEIAVLRHQLESNRPSPVVLTPTLRCMSPPWSTSSAGYLGPRSHRRPGDSMIHSFANLT
jgi:hypothetical protein